MPYGLVCKKLVDLGAYQMVKISLFVSIQHTKVTDVQTPHDVRLLAAWLGCSRTAKIGESSV